MFTGIVEGVGRVSGIATRSDGARIDVEIAGLTQGLVQGASVAVNGACLTVCETAGDRIAFDAVRETMDRTNLGDLEVGSRVNLERALRADGRLDGHIVQGHVDGTGTLRSLEEQGADVRFNVDCDASFAELLVEKGSIAIDGVSLTLVGVEGMGFGVALIPHTLRETNLGTRQPGERLNLEADILGKYVRRYIEQIAPFQGGG